MQGSGHRDQGTIEWVDTLQVKLGYRFRDAGLLLQALTHRSYANETRDNVLDNERLEFLGDAVLGAVISHLVMTRFPDRPEGDLTRIRASLVNENALARTSKRLHLGRFIRLGQGERRTGGREKRSILACCYEAVVGAVYLDGGYEAAFEMVRSHFSGILKRIGKTMPLEDFKTPLQDETQRRLRAVPRYTVLNERGPDHEKRFRVRVCVQGVTMGQGEGRTKKEAEQQAAREALGKLALTESPE